MYIQPDLKDRVKQFLEVPQKHMGDVLNINFTSFKTDEIKATMPVNENSVQPFGLLHGGASVTLAETLASVGAWLSLSDDQKTAVGIEINANHLRSARLGETVTGIAQPLKQGQKIQVWEIKIHNEKQKLVCASRCTLAIVNRS